VWSLYAYQNDNRVNEIYKFKFNLGVKGAVCGPRGTHLAGRCVPVKIWEMAFIPAKSDACMSSS